MRGSFAIRYTRAAREDLDRLFDFLLEHAQTEQDFDDAQLAIDCIRSAIEVHLSSTPFIYRKSGQSPFLRELIVPFRRGGYVVLYRIDDASNVRIAAIRQQLEDDYH